ncbi:MAG: diaminopimelate epimerase [Bacteroidota bacterium]|nr:diaminopimelate epimerase [Bacteroidota bacterium]
MLLHFYKYEGAGNDFIIIDNRISKLVLDKESVVSLCLRHFGIGADGLMLLENNAEGRNNIDFVMRFFNPDGSAGMMCGNGGRCIVRFAKDMGIIEGNKTIFLAPDGEHSAEILQGDNIALKMNNVAKFDFFSEGIWCNTGASHFVVPCLDVKKEDVLQRGRQLRYDQRFEKYNGANINFYTEINKNHLLIRTYERGVEGETLACGTGITATALCYAIRNNFPMGNHSIKISTLHNDLQVRFFKDDTSFSDIYLIGPAKKVFYGEIEIR